MVGAYLSQGKLGLARHARRDKMATKRKDAMESLLDQLKEMTVVVSDTGDINSIEKFKPRDATTNPSLIAAAAAMPAYAKIVDDALLWARKESKSASTEEIVKQAIDR